MASHPSIVQLVVDQAVAAAHPAVRACCNANHGAINSSGGVVLRGAVSTGAQLIRVTRICEEGIEGHTRPSCKETVRAGARLN